MQSIRGFLNLVIVVILIWPIGITAQQGPRLAIVIEDLDQDAAICGITLSSIESIAALTLRNNGINVAMSSTNPYLYVAATVLGNCAYHLQVSVQGTSTSDAVRTPMGGFNSRGLTRKTVLCNQHMIQTTSRSNASTNLLNQVEQQLKLCLGKLEY